MTGRVVTGRVAAVLPLLALSAGACSARGEDRSLIESLRVVATTAAPYTGPPGAPVELVVYTADPAREDFELLVWTCTPSVSPCAEAALPAFSDWVRVVPPEETRRETPLSWTLPDVGAAGTDPLTGEQGVPLWVLACSPGRCPIVAEAQRQLEAGEGPSLSLLQALSAPDLWLAELPLEGTSLGARVLPLSLEGEAVASLSVTPHFEAASTDPMALEGGQTLKMSLITEGTGHGRPLYSRVFTTLGSAYPSFLHTDGGPLQSGLTIPEEGGEGEVFVVSMVGDALYGPIGAWSSAVTVD